MQAEDMALVREYANHHSELAFAELVARYLNFVYSSALRRVGDAQLAEEITQVVFILLARKARKLGDKTILPSWLYRATRCTASDALKHQWRQRQRENSYMEFTNQSRLSDSDEAATEEAWPRIAPLLEAALDKLGEHDRSAVVLRFFENKTLAEISAVLGLSEDAARQRVNRALEKLRKVFAKNGVDSTAAAITGALSVNAIQAAPATLSKTVIAVALSKGAAASASTLTLINGALKVMAWTKAKTAIVLSACVLVTASATTSVIIFNRPKPPKGIPAGWSVIRGSPDQWSWSDGAIRGRSVEGDSLLVSTQTYKDITMSALVSTTNREASLAFRFQDADDGYFVVFTPAGILNWPAHVGLYKRLAGEEVTLGNYEGRVFSSLGQSAKVEVSAQGPWMQVRLNDVVVLRAKDTSFSSGFVGLRIYGDPGSPCDATYSNLTFR